MSKEGLLYTSHFLSAWNSRVFQFGSVLFLATQYPGTLFPVSVYALASVLPGALIGPKFGKYIDRNNRLVVVRWSILGQRVAVMLACLLFLFPLPQQWLMLSLLAVLGGLENSWSMVNSAAVERDWVVVVAGSNREMLSRLNARMRFIDLACKLLGPFLIGLVDSFDHRWAILTVFGMSLFSCGLEYWAIARVYNAVPELAYKPTQGPAAAANDQETAGLVAPAKFSFWKHPLMPVSLAQAFSYITVLAFSGQMIAYLLSSGMPVDTLTWFRTGSVIIELSATLLAPRAVRRWGPLRSASCFINFQWIVLVITAVLFSQYSNPASAIILSVGVAISRIGLWGFDLSTQIIVQDGVKESERGRYSTYEKSLQNWGMIILFVITMIFHDPHLFVWPVMVSVMTVGITMVMYNYFMYTHI